MLQKPRLIKFTRPLLIGLFFLMFAYKHTFLNKMLGDFLVLAAKCFLPLKEQELNYSTNSVAFFFILNIYKMRDQVVLSKKSELIPIYNQIIVIKICSFIVFRAYKAVYGILKDTYDLLNGKTYNPLMKRYDSVYLKVDQILISILLFTIMFIILRSIVFFYCLFLSMSILIKFFELVFLSAMSSGSYAAFLGGLEKNKYRIVKCIVSGNVSGLIDYDNRFGL